jgi:hypothetical protein
VTEQDLYAPILTTLSRAGTRLFRQNSGLAWQGNVIEHTPTRLILAHPRPLKMGVPGIADIGGFTSLEITPEMVGSLIAAYVGIELKSATGRATPEQLAFIAMVLKAGGRAGIARSVEDARAILEGNI